MQANIFSALARYNSATDENYLTEAFVFLIKSLLQQERAIGLEVLTKLCLKGDEYCFGMNEKITIKTQVQTEQGTPDIVISSPDKLIYIEVKHDSNLGYKQLNRYKKELESSEVSCKKLILLSRFSIDVEENQLKCCDRHVFWYEVYNWVAAGRAKTRDPICTYLMESFNSFLEEKQMSIQKVSWEYLNGIRAFNNLINMIEVAIKDVGIPVHTRIAAWDSKALWLDRKKHWCGVYYDQPLVVVFKTFHKRDLDMKRVEAPSYPVKEALESIWFQLQLKDKHFFSLEKDKQLDEITEFVKTAYKEAQQMRITED